MTTPGKKKVARWGSGRIALLSQLSEVRALVEGGWPLTRIYETRKEKLGGVSYAAFAANVRRYIGRLKRTQQESIVAAQQAEGRVEAHEAEGGGSTGSTEKAGGESGGGGVGFKRLKYDASTRDKKGLV